MNRRLIIFIIIAVVLIILVAVGCWYWFGIRKPESLPNIGGTAEDITNSATQGVLPSLNTNPLADKPNINPADNANPIKDIKINPFE